MHRRRPGGLAGVHASTDLREELLELQRSHENLRKSESFDKTLTTKRKMQLAEYYTSSSQCLAYYSHDRDDTASVSSAESLPATFTLGHDIPRKKKHGASVSFHPEACGDNDENSDDPDDENDDEEEEGDDSADDDSDGVEAQKDPDSTDDSGLGPETRRKMSKERRPSQVSKSRRPSYTCYHGPPLPRNTPKIGRRPKGIKRLRERDVLQLAAGTVVMLSTVTPELLRKAITSEVEIPCPNGQKRILRSTCDWNETAVNGDHLWCPTSASGDFCYVGEESCCKSGARLKCSACKIIAHTHCINTLVENVKFTCKPTFRDVGPRQYREQTTTHHHWVHRRNQKGKCKACNKGFQSKLLFGSKEIVAISCSWCKQAFHNREACFPISKLEETCTLGLHQSIIVPPSWIVKLPRRGSFKSSLRKSPKKRGSKKNKTKDKPEKETRTFAIKPIPNATVKPIIVFINPKSGGNQGAKLMQKFQWLLNPRQVFDLTQGGPRAGMDMFRKVSQLRVLACGGDGTVGWVLSVLDQMNIDPPPAVAVLPLGTGNDLARALGWGGGYTDEPISKILCNISDGEIIHLDRWKLDLKKNPDAEPTEEGKDTLPLSVLNNYFSFGVDAHIALAFHEAREANPQKFNSRLRNKMFYGQAGGKDLMQRKWRDLCEMCTLECDGKDLTPLLKEHRVHAVVFLNIPSYGSGTHPWNRSFGSEQRTDDSKIEVLGLTTYQMPLLQAGGHGTCLTQCSTARIVTKKTIPMQVDGEACRVNPAIIEISHLNKAPMVTKTKAKSNSVRTLEKVHLRVSVLSMKDYSIHHYDKEKLRQSAQNIFQLDMDQDRDLEQVRQEINRRMEELGKALLLENWVFLDSCTAERFFRIDKHQEHLHYVTDVCNDELYLLNPDEEAVSQSADSGASDSKDGSDRENNCSSAGSNNNVPVSVPTVIRTDVSQLLEKHSENLLKAVKADDLKMVKEIYSSGYSLLTIDSVGQTSLHYAAKLGHKDIVRFLIATAPPSILDLVDSDKGQTALHLAAANRRRSICCMLVAAGSSLTIKDNQGLTAQALALKANDVELSQYLESKSFEFRNIQESYLDMSLLCSLFEETEPDGEYDEDPANDNLNDTIDNYSTSSSSSSDRLDDSDTAFDRSSMCGEPPYQKMSRESTEYAFDIVASSNNTLNENMPVELCACTELPEPVLTPIPDYDYSIPVPPLSVVDSMSTFTAKSVPEEPEIPLVPVHGFQSSKILSEDNHEQEQCPDCINEIPVYENDNNIMREEIRGELVSAEQLQASNELPFVEKKKKSLIRGSFFSHGSKSDSQKQKSVSLAPVHSKGLKSFISPKKSSMTSRISNSLRSSSSVRSSKSSTNIRALGGSMRSTWSSEHCSSLSKIKDIPSPPLSHAGHSRSRTTPGSASLPSHPPPLPSVQSCSPLPPPHLIKDRRASSVVLALAATHASSSLALAYSSIKFPPLLTPETISQTQILTRALTEALIEEKRAFEESALSSRLGNKTSGSPKRLKLERLI